MDFIFCNAREQRVTDIQDEPESQVNSLIPIQAEPIQTKEGQLDLFNLLVERKEI